MIRIHKPLTIHEAEVAVFHAWGDGMRTHGPTPRHLTAPAAESFRAGLKISQADGDAGSAGGFGEWRRHPGEAMQADGWMVEMQAPLGTMWDEGEHVASLMPPGIPVVVVVRFRCRDTGAWRVYQFHDAVSMPMEAGEESQKLTRAIRFSAGWMEEFKSGTLPPLEPRVRGVIEWRHAGRTVRCWEYDPENDTWTEDAENTLTMDGVPVRYVSLDFTGGDVAVSMLAAVSQGSVAGGQQATAIGWIDVAVCDVTESSGLTMAPGWLLETAGCAEPLMLPESSRHWEHPKMVFRVLGRLYGTAQAGVLAIPALHEGPPDYPPMDLPIRLGDLLLYPEGGRIY
jgi:hypothetical protein